MSEKDEQIFQSSNKRWINDKLFDVVDNKVRDQCHITRKYRGSAHWSCNVNLKLTKKVSVIFHNLKGYSSHLIMPKISKFDVKISAKPNGFEKCMAFTINNNLVFTDSMQVMNSSLNKLAKNLSDNGFKYLSQEFRGDLKLVKQKAVYPCEYTVSFLRRNFCIRIYIFCFKQKELTHKQKAKGSKKKKKNKRNQKCCCC